MKPDVKAQWVAALRSGEYKQGQHYLRFNDSFCCLGVLCNLHAQAHPDIAAAQHSPMRYLGHTSALPSAVQEWAGLPHEYDGAFVTIRGSLAHLAIHNDNGRTFDEIATAIEEQL